MWTFQLSQTISRAERLQPSEHLWRQVRAASNQDFWASLLFLLLFLLLIIWKRKSFARGKLQNCHFKCFVLFSKHIRTRTKGRGGEPKKCFQVKNGQPGGQNFGGRVLLHPVRPVSRQNWGERAKTLSSINAILPSEWIVTVRDCGKQLDTNGKFASEEL